MASNMFKRRYIPNADGTDSTTPATNANTAFVHTYLGDDNTGDGTRERPFRSYNRAYQKTGITYILFRGVINEYFNSASKTLIGDDINQVLILSNYSYNISGITLSNLTSDKLVGDNWSKSQMIICTGRVSQEGSFYSGVNNCLQKSLPFKSISNLSGTVRGNTFYAIESDSNNMYDISNTIVIRYFNKQSLVSKFSRLKNVLMLSSLVVKVVSSNAVLPAFQDDSRVNLSALKNAMIASGMSGDSISELLPLDSFGNETCLIVKENRSGGTRPNVFNRYTPNITGTLDAPITANTAKTSITLTVQDASKVPDTGDFFIPFIGTYTNNGASITDGNEVFTYTSKTIDSPTSVTLNGASYTFKMPHSAGVVCTRYGDVLDYTLNQDVRNEALYASDTGGYVGCFAPAVKKEFSSFTAPANVNADGTDAGSGGDLMQFNDTYGLTFNNASAQTWNRIRTTQIIEIQRGQRFNGLNVMSQDGSPFGYYVGKHQNLIGTDKILAGGNLTVGKIYKIFNDTGKDTTRGIIYNGVNYFPEYTFVCVAGTLSFAEINPGSGTYVREVLADVLESVEVLPYDYVATPSAFPRFSAPLMGEPKLILYTATGAARYGKAIGAPVLFSHLKEANFIADFGAVNDKIAYYDSFAVSNADQEFYRLTNAELNATLKGYFKTDIPLLKYLHLEINGHFDEPYDY